MKPIVLAIAFLMTFSAVCLAQASFQLLPQSVTTTVHDTIIDAEGHNNIKNNDGTAKTIRWTRSVICYNPTTLTSQICDPNLCYLPHVSTKTFNLPANATLPMVVHFLKPYGTYGAAIIALKFQNVANPADTLTSIYIFNSCATTSVDDQLPQATVKFFPNPTTDFFTLVGDEAVETIKVYNMSGQEVSTFQAIPGTVYSLNGKPAGTYIIGLFDNKGRVFQASELVKQ
jgi:hypothetical protein